MLLLLKGGILLLFMVSSEGGEAVVNLACCDPRDVGRSSPFNLIADRRVLSDVGLWRKDCARRRVRGFRLMKAYDISIDNKVFSKTVDLEHSSYWGLKNVLQRK